MCPFCLATAAVVAASATGTGGVAALCHRQDAADSDSKSISPKQPTRRRFNMATMTTAPKLEKVVSHSEWIEARRQFLAKEKEFTRLRDELSRQRRELPWEKVEKDYVFEGPRGKETLADLFDGRSQLRDLSLHAWPGMGGGMSELLVYFGSFRWNDDSPGASRRNACGGFTCSLCARSRHSRSAWDGNFTGHLRLARTSISTTMFRLRAAETGNGNGRLQLRHHAVPERRAAGRSVFAKDAEGQIYHTYSDVCAGLDILVGAYNFLDLVPKGRDEEGLAHTMAWVRHHDKYDGGYFVDPNQKYEQPKDGNSGILLLGRA